MYIPGPKYVIELDVGGFMLGEIIAYVLATPVQASLGGSPACMSARLGKQVLLCVCCLFF